MSKLGPLSPNITKPMDFFLDPVEICNAKAQVNCDPSQIKMQPSELLTLSGIRIPDGHVSLDFSEALEDLLQVQPHAVPIFHQPGLQAVGKL